MDKKAVVHIHNGVLLFLQFKWKYYIMYEYSIPECGPIDVQGIFGTFKYTVSISLIPIQGLKVSKIYIHL